MGALRNATKSIGFGAIQKELGNPISAQLIGGGKRYNRTNKSGEQLLAEYNGYVYRAIDVIATNVAAVPLFTEQLINGTWQRRDHQYMQFLQGTDASPDLTWLRTGITTYRQMLGEAFIYVSVLEQSRKPQDRVLLYPDRVKVLADDHGKILGYIYTTEKGNQIPLQDDEILHFKRFNPRNHLRGYGPLQAAGLYVDAERNTMEYVATFIENNATPSGIIVLPNTTGEAQFNMFERQWREKYGGAGNAGKTAILQAENVDFKQISSNIKDMQLNELRTVSRDDILGVLGVSKHMVGISDEGGLGRNTAEAHEYIFAKHTLVPELQAEINVHNDAMKRYYGTAANGWRVNFENPIPEDKEYKLNTITSGGAVMTLNERRQLLGLPPVNNGDVLVDANGTEYTTKANTKKTLTVKIKSVKPTAHKDIEAEAKEAYRLRIQDKQSKYEKEFAKTLIPFFKDQKARVLEDLVGKKAVKSIADGNLNPASEASAMTDLSIGVFMDLLQEQGDLAIKFAGDTEAFDITPDMRKTIGDNLRRTTQDFSDETVKGLTATLTEGLKEGESLISLGKRVDRYYETILGGTASDLKGYRLARLVRTETLKASNLATQYGYMQLGITHKEWFNNPGACEFCQAVKEKGQMGVAEEYVALNETIRTVDKNGEVVERVFDYEAVEHPPLHPNCRCVLIPVRVK